MNNQNNENIKVMLIGNQQVGKTALSSYLTNKQVNPNEYRQSTTIGLNTVQQQITKSKLMTINMYDTPGNREYSMLIRGGLKNIHYVVFCYNPGNPQSFEDIENYWINDIIGGSDNVKQLNTVLLAINKTNNMNQMSDNQMNNNNNNIQNEVVKAFCDKYNITQLKSINLNNRQEINQIIDYYVQHLHPHDKGCCGARKYLCC